jgi:hypothetical protein
MTSTTTELPTPKEYRQMKATKLFLAFAVALAASSLATAQTTTKYLLGAKDCISPWTGTYYCAGIPITRLADGSQPSPANANPATVWSNLVYNGRPNLFIFNGNDGLGNFSVTATPTDVATNVPGVRQVTAGLVYLNPDGTIAATGSVTFLYTLGTRHCSGGRGGGCSTPWSIASGMVEVTK